MEQGDNRNNYEEVNMSSLSWVKEMLDHSELHYERRTHPEAYTAKEVAAAEHMDPSWVAKVVVVMADNSPLILVLSADRYVVMEAVREAVNAESIRLASEEELKRFFFDCEVGTMPPLRHWRSMGVLMDRTLRRKGDILFQSGTHRDAIKINFDDWFRLVRPCVESFSRPNPFLITNT